MVSSRAVGHGAATGHHSNVFPALVWHPVEFVSGIDRFGVLGSTRGGPERHPGVRHQVFLAAANGELAGAAVLPLEGIPSVPHRRILHGRLRLDLTGSVHSEPWTRRTVPASVHAHTAWCTAPTGARHVSTESAAKGQPTVSRVRFVKKAPRFPVN